MRERTSSATCLIVLRGVVRWNSFVEVDEGEHSGLWVAFASHGRSPLLSLVELFYSTDSVKTAYAAFFSSLPNPLSGCFQPGTVHLPAGALSRRLLARSDPQPFGSLSPGIPLRGAGPERQPCGSISGAGPQQLAPMTAPAIRPSPDSVRIPPSLNSTPTAVWTANGRDRPDDAPRSPSASNNRSRASGIHGSAVPNLTRSDLSTALYALSPTLRMCGRQLATDPLPGGARHAEPSPPD